MTLPMPQGSGNTATATATTLTTSATTATACCIYHICAGWSHTSWPRSHWRVERHYCLRLLLLLWQLSRHVTYFRRTANQSTYCCYCLMHALLFCQCVLLLRVSSHYHVILLCLSLSPWPPRRRWASTQHAMDVYWTYYDWWCGGEPNILGISREKRCYAPCSGIYQAPGSWLCG